MKPMAIRWRLGLSIAAVIVGEIVMLSYFAYDEMREALNGNINTSLLAVANAVSTAFDDQVENTGEAGAADDEPDVDTESDLLEDVAAIVNRVVPGQLSACRVWEESSGRTIFTTEVPGSREARWMSELTDSAPPPPGYPCFLDLENGTRYRAVWVRYAVNGTTVDVLLVRSCEYVYTELREFLWRLLILGGSAVAISLAGVFAFVIWSLRPIRQTAVRLSGLTHRNLREANLAELTPPPELSGFVEAVHDLLARLDDTIRREQQFTSDAAHELRTPLAVAKSTLQAIGVRERQPDEYKEAISEAIEDLERIEKLTGQLLLLARMDADECVADVSAVRMDELVPRTVQAFIVRARQKGGSITCADELPDTVVRGNEEQLALMLGNILANAVQHGPDGRPICVNLYRNTGTTCTVVIHDDGFIPPEILARVFDRFYRADASRARISGGSGLGLAIARKVARLHGGEIRIESAPETGTRVLITLSRLVEPA